MLIRHLTSILLLLLLAVPALAEEAHVLRGIDGDSLRIEVRGIEVDCRLLGIDAPEWNNPGGPRPRPLLNNG